MKRQLNREMIGLDAYSIGNIIHMESSNSE